MQVYHLSADFDPVFMKVQILPCRIAQMGIFPVENNKSFIYFGKQFNFGLNIKNYQ